MNFNDGSYNPPPRSVKLSDKNVNLVTKTVSYNRRGKDYPDNFNRASDIKPERTRKDPTPLFEVCGLFFFAVYKGYYILRGRRYLMRFRTKLTNKIDKAIIAASAG